MKINNTTDHITIGRNPALTLAVMSGIVARRKKQERRRARWAWLFRFIRRKPQATT
jgi:hypothetical protein